MTPPDRAGQNGGTAVAAGVARLRAAGFSDPGMVRDNNEDRYHVDAARGIFIVVDGMGGQVGGEVAAATAIETLKRRLEQITGSAERRVREAIADANNQVFRLGQRDPNNAGMGCVLTLAVVEGNVVTVGHVGDSRLYHLSEGRLRKVTHDHSPVGVREDKGELSEREAMFHPRRNEVFRSVGGEEHGPDDAEFIEIDRFTLGDSDAFLICSDGLTDLVPAAEILRIVRRDAPDERALVRALVDAANQAGGKDNVTVVVGASARFGRGAPSPRSKPASTPVATWGGSLGAVLNRRSTFFVLGALIGIALFAAFSLFDRGASDLGGAAAPSLAHGGGRLEVGPGRAYATIVKAMTAARPGDTVMVAPGRYHERNVTVEEGVTLMGDPAGEVILEPGVHGAIGFTGVTADNIGSGRISGFTIVGDPNLPLDVGIGVHSAIVTIENVEIRGMVRAGVAVDGHGSATVIGSSIRECRGPGILVAPNSTARIVRNWIVDNGKNVNDAGPGIELGAGARAIVLDNVITGNAAEGIRAAPESLDPSILRANLFEVPGRKRNARGPSTATR